MDSEINEPLYSYISSMSVNLLEIADDVSSHPERSISSQNLFDYIIYQTSLLVSVLENHKAYGSSRWQQFYRLTRQLRIAASIVKEILFLERINRGSGDAAIFSRFLEDNERLKGISIKIFVNLCSLLLRESMALPLTCQLGPVDPDIYRDDLLFDDFPQDYRGEAGPIEENILVNLANEYLNLSGEYQHLKPPGLDKQADVMDFIQARLSEERLDSLEYKSRHIKKLFEKHLDYSRASSIPRGGEIIHLHRYISSITCLIKLCYQILRFNKSHSLMKNVYHLDTYITKENGFSPGDFYWFIISYVFFYIDYFLKDGAEICRKVMKVYIETGEKVLPVPLYRGFHVRPSTIISRIIRHYGSEVTLTIDGESYNAASPFELFRVNETINRRKRNSINELLVRYLEEYAEKHGERRAEELYRQGLTYLISEKKIQLANSSILLETGSGEGKEDSLNERIAAVIDRIDSLLMEGKISVLMDSDVVFRGDTRVLRDLEILAGCGYGEDEHGKNVTLPDSLSYIQREWYG